VDINEFYTRVLTSLDVEVVDDYLMIKDNEKLINYSAGGVPLVLPTKKNISSMLDEDEDGKIITVKQLFNPLDETVIKGDSTSLTKLKKLVEIRLGNKALIVGSLLLSIAENAAHQSKTSMLINQFLVRLTEAKNPGMAKVVDDKTNDKWCKLYNNSFIAGNDKFLTVFVKKGGKLGTTKYHRVTTMKFPIYEALRKLEKGGRINGVTLRNKDVKVFKILFEYLIEGINARGIVSVGSNDKESPGFISLFGKYLNIMGKIQTVLSGINGVDAEWEDTGRVTLLVEPSELTELGKYKRELLRIPREGDVIKTKLVNRGPVIATPSVNQDAVVQQPIPATEEVIDPTTSAIRTALYGNTTGINTPMLPQQQPQQPMYRQPQAQPYPQQPLPQQQPVPQQQPMYQQPQAQPYPQQPVPQQQPMYQQPYPQQPVSIGAVGVTSAYGGAPQQPQQPRRSPWDR